MALKRFRVLCIFFQRAILQQFPCSALNPYQKQYELAVVWSIRLNLLACHAVNSRLRSAAMKAPVGLLSGRVVLRSKMGGIAPTSSVGFVTESVRVYKVRQDGFANFIAGMR